MKARQILLQLFLCPFTFARDVSRSAKSNMRNIFLRGTNIYPGNAASRRAQIKILAALIFVRRVSAFAGVTVTQIVSPGATNWPGSLMFINMTNPTSQTSVGESFNSVGGCTNYCETFTITTTNCRCRPSAFMRAAARARGRAQISRGLAGMGDQQFAAAAG